jgi:hypothetical protein
MNMHRWFWRSLPTVSMATALVAGGASLSWAQWGSNGINRGQGEELFEWNGSVDREVQITMRGNRVWTNNVGATESGRYNARPFGNIPRQNGQVVVQVMNGRGDVDVIQQPSAQNGYSTTVRIRDPRSGSDRYRVVAYYEGYSGGDVYGRDDRSHGRRGDEMRRRGDDDDRDGNYDRNRGGQSGNTVMHWTGNVDDLLEIRMQNGQLLYRTLRGNQPTGMRANQAGSMPNGNATMSVVQRSGRGTVSVVQQPSAWNGYTTVLRVEDPQNGYGYYDFDLVWR